MNNFPKVRTESLITQEADGELLMYDVGTGRALCLNDTSQNVMQYCDGETNFDQISEKTGLPKELVWLAVEEFQKHNLLEHKIETELPKDRVSRRKVLIRAGKAAIALPLVASIVAPHAVQAQSGTAMLCTGPPGSPSGTVLFGGNICGAPLADCIAACTPEGVTMCCSMAATLTPGCPNCRCVCT